MNRRSFLIGLGSGLVAAPAIVRAASLMPVRGVRGLSKLEIVNRALVDAGAPLNNAQFLASLEQQMSFALCRTAIDARQAARNLNSLRAASYEMSRP